MVSSSRVSSLLRAMVASSGLSSLLRIAPDRHTRCNCDIVAASDLRAACGVVPGIIMKETETNSELVVSQNGTPKSKEAVETFTTSEIHKHNSPEDAWIVVDGKVYNITEFVDIHPGGAEIIFEHISQADLGELMRGSSHPEAHFHSQAAFRMLSQFMIGTVESAYRDDEKGSTNNLKPHSSSISSTNFEVDLTKPLVFQVGNLGERYQAWIHDPLVCNEPPRFFQSDVAELLTTTKWWIIPIVWLPFVFWMESTAVKAGYSFLFLIFLMLSGALVWTLLEYLIHRFLFHMKTRSYWANTLHYLLHGFHHKHPMDGSRLVFPPAFTAVFVLLIWFTADLIATYTFKSAMFGGGLFAYVIYDLTHYYLHFGVASNNYSRYLKRYHLNHHFKVQTDAFGITSTLWDWTFETLPREEAQRSRLTALKKE
ncbi:hypothetical protein O6H91_04G133500 [Diphasiastrum complanatum]|uniref:Uncharacterized protein n=1 Tax=Diphasiastrum complanatum TaxID=34168 RepID=A0ACC2E1N4_DIPCM|nr:hypothetical protein O6H91_04G133500 [Diphasiastrum complanatum]